MIEEVKISATASADAQWALRWSLLTRIKLDAQMKAFGQWEDFKGGRPGGVL
jgi:hypothetical protein